MKILIVGPKSIHVSSFIEALNQKGIIPNFLTEEKLDYEQIENNYVTRFRSKNPFSILWNYWSLKRIIRKSKLDVVHIHQANRLAYFVTKICAKKSIPCVLTAWGSDVLIIPKANKLYRFLTKKTLQRCRYVTADSKSMITAMMELVPIKDKYVLLQYGITPVQPGVKEKIIYSNRLHYPLYRIDQVINYFNQFQKEYPEWKLIIAGSGSETVKLNEMVNTCNLENKVTFVGWIDSLQNNEWYSKSSIYISIPESDGTSVSLLEAMSAGCLPIVPNIEVSLEWILDGKNGVIEKEGTNPLIESMELLNLPFQTINNGLIEASALKSVNTKRFIDLYSKE